jgi:hypothetical protein
MSGFALHFAFLVLCYFNLCSELKNCDGYLRDEPWVPENYDRIAAAIENNDESVETFSLRGKCVLNELSTFHATTSFAPDLMHDFLGN